MKARLVSWTVRSTRLITAAVLVIGLVGIGLAWLAYGWEVRQDSAQIRDLAQARLQDVAKSMEEHVGRTLAGVNVASQYLRHTWMYDREAFAGVAADMQAASVAGLILQIAVLDADGWAAFSTAASPAAQPINFADREHFRVHKDGTEDSLFISKPVVGRMTKRPMIQMTRRITDEAGRFAGVVVMAIAPEDMIRIYDHLNLGPDGAVAIVGLDRVARAWASRRAVDLGGEIPADRPYFTASQGVFEAIGALDGEARLFAFRHLKHYPLVVVASETLADLDAAAASRRRQWLGIALSASAGIAAFTLTVAAFFHTLAHRQRQLDEAQRMSELILASVGEGICGLDGAGRIGFINGTAERLLGWSEAAIPGHFHRADQPVEGCPLCGMLGAKGAASGEVCWRLGGGDLWVEATVAPLVKDGVVAGVVVAFRDITQRKQAEARMARDLAVTEALGRILRLSMTETPLDRLLDMALGELLSLPWLNPGEQACIFLGQRESGTLRLAAQRNLAPEMCARWAIVPLGQCLCGRAATSGCMLHADCVDAPPETLLPDVSDGGRYCMPIRAGNEVLGVLQIHLPGHRHEEERLLLLIADTLAGVIARRGIEQSLRNSEALAKTLLNATADAAFLMDRDGVILAANEALAARFGKGSEDLLGRNFFDLIPAPLARSRHAQFEQVLSQGQPLHTHDERDGHVLDNRVYPVADATGSAIRVAVFSRDVTDQLQAAKAKEKALTDLARSNEELQQFAYVASHDLRQPLRMVTSYLKLIERSMGEQLSGEIKEFFDFAINGALRMDHLIIDLLEYSRAGRGAAPLEPVPLAEVVAEALINLQVAIREADGRIVVSEDLPLVVGDHSELTRLFQNLVGNAVKYRNRSGRPQVEIGARQEGAQWLVWVRDNGIGIAPEDHERAFRIFQRLAPSEACQEGTGIGLAICKRIVEHHGGRIWVESDLGVGSTFFLTLPAGDAGSPMVDAGAQTK